MASRFRFARLAILAVLAAVYFGAGRQRVDAMLVDIGMPEEDGYSFLRRVKQGSIPGSVGVPIAAVTAYVSQDDVQRGTFEGFDAYLKKPFDPHIVVRTVARMTQQAKRI